MKTRLGKRIAKLVGLFVMVIAAGAVGLIAPEPAKSAASGDSYLFVPIISHHKGWQVIKEETFEGPFPNDWDVAGFSSNGDFDWGARNCDSYNGNRSGWAVGAGANGSSKACNTLYPNDTFTIMEYGPFSLVDADDAAFDFRVKPNLNDSGDVFFWGASINGSSYYGNAFFGPFDTNFWLKVNFDLTDVYTLGDLTGEPNVWIAFIFDTDESGSDPNGIFVDDILLRLCLVDDICPDTTAPEAVFEQVIFDQYGNREGSRTKP